MTEVAFIALGSNLGDRAQHLHNARRSLGSLPESRVLAASGIDETEPLGGLAQPPYLNQMVALETTLEPRALLAALKAIERAEGRTSQERWASRTLDLDIVRYGDREIHETELHIPHPGIASRDFWRRELGDLQAQLGASAPP